jgi:hypothetical protein
VSPLLHNRYERTCRACGYSWVLTRREAAQHPPLINRFEDLEGTGLIGRVGGVGVGGGSDTAAIQSVDAEEEIRLEAYEEMLRCPSCRSIDDFTERPVTKAHPADDPAHGVEVAGPPLGRLSEDRQTFWNGTAWITTISKDGTMRWDGMHWVPN